MPKVVIIGAGFGGLGCAHTLAALGETDVTVVDAKDWFTIGGCWQFVWTGRLPSEQAIWPLAEAKLAGVDVRLNTRVARLDVEAHQVHLDDGSCLAYEQLVLSPGIVGDPASVSGQHAALDIFSFDSLPRQQAELAEFVAAAKAGANPTLLVAICGVPYKCPVAPVEIVCLVDDALRTAGCREGARIVLSSPVEWPMPDPAKPVLTAKLTERGIDYLATKPLAKLEPGEGGGCVATFVDGDTLEASHCWAAYKQSAPTFVREAGLTNERGFVPVDLQTNRVSGPHAESAFCIGDCCTTMVGAKPHPKAGEFAWQMGVAVAQQIAQQSEPLARKGACIVELGQGAGVLVAPDFTQVLADPLNGKPSFSIVDREGPDGERQKTEWINGYIRTIFGEQARMFAAGA